MSDAKKKMAKITADAFGVEKPPISHLWDEKNISDVYVLAAVDRPQKGVVSYATVGLSESPLIRDGMEFGTRVELMGACGRDFVDFDKIIATLSFCVINSKWFCAPGAIFPGVIDMHHLSDTMSDIYFTNPFLWGDEFKSMEIDGRLTAWLLAVPISKKETEFAVRYGADKLEDIFSEKNIDIYNLNRPSVV